MSRGSDERIDISGLEFEWYPPKAESNWRKHRVSFQEALTIFADKQRLEVPDVEHSEEEFRFVGIGRSEDGRILFVSFAVRAERIRIISARAAEPWERREYERPDRDE